MERGGRVADVPPRTPPISCARRYRTGTEAFPGRCAGPRATARRGDSASRRQICDGRRRKQEKARRRSERGGWTIARRCDQGRRRERAEPRARRRSRRVHLAPRNAARVSRWCARRARASRRVAKAVRLSSARRREWRRCRRLSVARDVPRRENHPEQRVAVVHARGHRRSASRAPFDGVEELDSLRASRHPDRSVASRSNRRPSKLPLRTSGELPHLRAALVPRDPARTDLVYLPGRTRRRRLCGRAPLASATLEARTRKPRTWTQALSREKRDHQNPLQNPRVKQDPMSSPHE